MRIKEIKEKEVWEKFLEGCKEKTFLSSFNWGEFCQRRGEKVWRLGVFEKELISVAQVIKIEAKRGKFLFLPHGPNLIQNSSFKVQNLKFEVLKILVEKLKEIAKKERCDFIRIAPIWERKKENLEIFQSLNFREAPLHLHPETTWELDISLSEDEILKKMRKTTRYLIRQALKNPEIKIEEKNEIEGIEEFNQIYKITHRRHKFVPFSLDYLKKEFLTFSRDDQISVLLAKYKGEVIAGGIFIFWQKTAYYHHGASSLKYPKIPASYLLIFKAIKKAKEKKCQKFNFWGISERDFKFKILNLKVGLHPWKGLTLFKKGFGGWEKKYLKTQDLPQNFKYWFSFFLEKLRKIKRGL